MVLSPYSPLKKRFLAGVGFSVVVRFAVVPAEARKSPYKFFPASGASHQFSFWITDRRTFDFAELDVRSPSNDDAL